MNAEKILSCISPGDLFTSPELMESEYRELSKKWHPDKSKDPRASEVQAKINVLYQTGIAHKDGGQWIAKTRRVYTLESSKKLDVRFRSQRTFELGEMFVGDTSVIFVIAKPHKKLADRMLETIKGFKYANGAMRDEMKKYLPSLAAKPMTTDKGETVIPIEKTEDVYLLSDVVTYLGDKMTPRHAAWIVSTLYNNVCYFNYLGMAHCGLEMTSYFISPLYHSGLPLGGWWYVVEYGTKLKTMPFNVYNVMPARVQLSKIADPTIDLESVKAIGRQLMNADTPKEVSKFLSSASSDSAVDEYKLWIECLKKGFGGRRFVKMEIDSETFYKRS